MHVKDGGHGGYGAETVVEGIEQMRRAVVLSFCKCLHGAVYEIMMLILILYFNETATTC